MRASLLLGAAALGLLAFSGKKGSGSSVVQRRSQQATLLNPGASMAAMGLAESDWPALTFDIPFGAGSPSPIWPTVTSHSKKYVVSYKTAPGQIVGNSSRRFMVSRDGGARYHVGIDLYGNAGDVILATEDCTITNTYYFYHGTYSLFVQCNSGLVINYGEVAKNSWKEFGLDEGSRVRRGQPISRIGQLSGGSHMLHFETYMPPTESNEKYRGRDPGPILNPTYYLLRAQFLALGAGRAFAGTDCTAYGSLNRPIPPELQHIAEEDERVGDGPGDSVLPELLTDGDWRPEKDRADGP